MEQVGKDIFFKVWLAGILQLIQIHNVFSIIVLCAYVCTVCVCISFESIYACTFVLWVYTVCVFMTVLWVYMLMFVTVFWVYVCVSCRPHYFRHGTQTVCELYPFQTSCPTAESSSTLCLIGRPGNKRQGDLSRHLNRSNQPDPETSNLPGQSPRKREQRWPGKFQLS